MKVLFLDCDGVINCEDTFHKDHDMWIPIDPYMAFLVGRIQMNTDCKVVLSSSWRHHKESVEGLNKKVVPIFDCTGDEPHLDGEKTQRGREIQKWLDAHQEVTNYAILDDDSDMLDSQMPNFFKTFWKEGLTTATAEKVIQHLNRKKAR